MGFYKSPSSKRSIYFEGLVRFYNWSRGKMIISIGSDPSSWSKGEVEGPGRPKYR